MPASRSAVIRKAKRAGWRARQRQGRGGGREYDLRSLPTETRAAIALQECSEPEPVPEARRAAIGGQIGERRSRQARERGLMQLTDLDRASRRRAEARLEILSLFEDFHRASSLPHSTALQSFCAAYNDGRVEAADWVRERVTHCHISTVYRWLRALKRDGAARLGGTYGGCPRSKIDTQEPLLAYCKAFLTDFPHATGKHLHDGLLARFHDDESIEFPSRRAVERWLTHWRRDHAELFAAVANPDAWKNRYLSAFGSASETITRANQRWEMDSTPADVMLSDGRHSIIGVIDVGTRRLRYLVSRTSKATAVAALLRRAMLDWGVPEQIKTDNGSDYTSHHITRVLRGLDIEQIRCNPFSGWEKPHIERSFRTFSHDLVELLPGYIGHSVADRSAIEARHSFADRLLKKDQVVEIGMSADELQAFCDRWTDEIYAHQAHQGLDGRTPFEAAAGAAIHSIQDERALDLLLAEAPGDGMRRVTKKGIRLEHSHYIAPELGELVGEQVHVRFDETDVGRIAVYHRGAFVCWAECPEITGVSRQEIAREARRRQLERVQAIRREMKRAAKEQNTRGIAEEILEHRSRGHDQVVRFPAPEFEHATDDLEAASEAADARDGTEQISEEPFLDPETMERLAHEIREEQQEEETAEQRFRDWILKNARRAELSEFEERQLRVYETSIEFQARLSIYEEYGPGAFGIRDLESEVAKQRGE